MASDQSVRLKKETDTTDTRKDSLSSDMDQGLVVTYYDEQQIHAILGLPSMNTITPQVQQGSTPAASFVNFIPWMDQVCTQTCSTSLVYWSAGPGQPPQRQPQLFHQMHQDEHAPVVGTITGYHGWRRVCENAGI